MTAMFFTLGWCHLQQGYAEKRTNVDCHEEQAKLKQISRRRAAGVPDTPTFVVGLQF